MIYDRRVLSCLAAELRAVLCCAVLGGGAVCQMQTLEDAQEESGWKLVHGDVFRPPSFSPMLLSIMCGTGMQVLAMTLSTITFALMGFLSPANRYENLRRDMGDGMWCVVA